MAVCERCGKHKQRGNNVSHSKVATKRWFKPNIQQTRILENGQLRRVKLCTRCIRTMAKAPRGI